MKGLTGIKKLGYREKDLQENKHLNENPFS